MVIKKSILAAFVLMLAGFSVYAEITLEECRETVLAANPLQAHYRIIESRRELDLSLTNQTWLPGFFISGKAAYQSDVTAFPDSIPVLGGVETHKDQYQIAGELNQLLWDGNRTASRRELVNAGAEAEKKQTEVDLYALNDQVNRLYLGVLLTDSQSRQTALLKAELELNRDRVSAFIRNGVAHQSDLDAVEVELLNVEQRRIELTAARKAGIAALGALMGRELEEDTVFAVPETKGMAGLISPEVSGENLRPELELFAARKGLIEAKQKGLVAGLFPTASFFIQGGYGRPGLNLFNPDFDTFLITGIRFSWDLSGFYRYSKNREKYSLEKASVDSREAAFRLNSRVQSLQARKEIEKIRGLMSLDDQIIALRMQMKSAAETQLANGTISNTDMIREINAGSRAVQQKAIHEIQLMYALFSLQFINNR